MSEEKNTAICAKCGSSNIVHFDEVDEMEHNEEWDECRDCGSDDILEGVEI